MARRVAAAAVGVLVVLGVACAGPDGAEEELRAARGSTVEVLAVWDSVEAARFERVLAHVSRTTGVQVTYTSTEGEDIGTVLDRRAASGDVPDLAILPQPGLLRSRARDGVLVPIDDVVGDVVRAQWSRTWQRLGTVDDRLYGVWFKAANKSLVWYRLAAFEQAGVVPPSDLDGFVSVAHAVTDTGTPAFAVSGDDEWTVTDWFENVYLRTAGPERYDALAEHRMPWTDRTVLEALTLMAELLSPPLAVSGPDGPAATTFEDAVRLVFGDAPAAAMVVEGDFVGGAITGTTTAELGVDADVFPFPDVDTSRRLVVGGGDAVVLLRSSAGARVVLRALATPEAAEVWAAVGGFVSPNEYVDLSVYPDDISRSIARSVIEAGDGFRFDLSDLQPAAFGATSGQGMFGILAGFLADPHDVAGTAARLEAAAAAAYGVNGAATPDARASRALRSAARFPRPTPASSGTGGRSS